MLSIILNKLSRFNTVRARTPSAGAPNFPPPILAVFSQDFIFKFDIGLQTLQDDLEEMLTNVPSSV